MTQRYTIQAVIHPGDESGYAAECLDLAVVTQGQTLDETVQNLREAIQLHLAGENLAEMGLTSHHEAPSAEGSGHSPLKHCV